MPALVPLILCRIMRPRNWSGPCSHAGRPSIPHEPARYCSRWRSTCGSAIPGVISGAEELVFNCLLFGPDSQTCCNHPRDFTPVYAKVMAISLVASASLALVAILVFSALRTALRAGLRDLPGPFLARFSALYRLSLVYRGKAPFEYRKLHNKYGPVVRVGPNHVSISDPAAIPQIYGIGSGYLKASWDGHTILTVN